MQFTVNIVMIIFCLYISSITIVEIMNYLGCDLWYDDLGDFLFNLIPFFCILGMICSIVVLIGSFTI